MEEIIIIAVTLLFSAFFSGMEIAFISSNKLWLAVEEKQEKKSSRLIAVFTKNPGQYIATMLVGNNITLVIYGIYMGIILRPYIKYLSLNEPTILVLQTLISTFFILITGEFLPKTFFRINPNKALNTLVIPVMIFYVLLYPVTKVTLFFTNIVLKKIFSVPSYTRKDKIIFGRADLDYFIHEIQRTKRPCSGIEHDIKIFQNALDFSKVKLRECIVPRTEIEAIDIDDSIENLKYLFIETRLSRILVYKGHIDNIIGYFHVSDIIKNPKTIRAKLRPISVVPETMPANKLLASFIKEHKSLAVVVDEFGGTSGMVTIEDVIEEIFGEIEDEHDIPELIEKQINDNEYIFSARLEIDTINEKYRLDIPESDEYETIAGFILYHHKNLPYENETININQFNIHVLKVSTTRIELIRLSVKN